jgi:hypothetical protein
MDVKKVQKGCAGGNELARPTVRGTKLSQLASEGALDSSSAEGAAYSSPR